MTAPDTKERLLRELWNREGRYYDLAREQVRAAATLDGEYEFLRRWLPVRGTVLEVGCGEGSNLDVVARPGLRFVGCDLSALGLARARAASRAPRREAGGSVATLTVASIKALGRKSSSRDPAIRGVEGTGHASAAHPSAVAMGAGHASSVLSGNLASVASASTRDADHRAATDAAGAPSRTTAFPDPLPAFLCADAERLPFPDRHFDAAFAVSLLEHLPDPGRVVEEMIRVLAPGGRLVLISPQYGGPLGASPCRRGGGAGRFLRRLARAHLPRPRAGGAVDRRSAWTPPSLGAASAVAAPAGTSLAGASSAGASSTDAFSSGASSAGASSGGDVVSRRSAAGPFVPRAPLDWDRVEPLVLQGAVYDGDLDAVIEPELASLKRFLRARGVTIEAATSGFEWHTWTGRRASLPQRAARAHPRAAGARGHPALP